jgi:hypothetical protein
VQASTAEINARTDPKQRSAQRKRTFICRYGTIGNERLVKLRKIVGRVRVLHQNEIDPGFETCSSCKTSVRKS